MSRRLMIVDATATNRIALKAALTAANYDVRALADADQALAELARIEATAPDTLPDLILADAALPAMDGAAFCTALARNAGAADRPPVPVVLLTDAMAPADRLAALAAGASALMARPLDRAWLLTHVRALLRAHEAQRELRRRDATALHLGFAEPGAGFEGAARVALVGARRDRVAVMARGLRAATAHPLQLLEPAEALIAAGTPPPPEAFVLGDCGDADETLWILSELRARTETRRAAILVEHGPRDRAFGARALDLGASDLIEAGADPREVALRLTRQIGLKRDADRLRATVDAGLAMAARDPLTGLYNRRYAEHHLGELGRMTRAAGRGYGVLVVDVDHFKGVNDTHGHAAGDAVLIEVATRLSQHIRNVDLIARIGGEEFMVALPDTSPGEAVLAAERLRRAMSDKPVTLPDGRGLAITVSIGAACATDPAPPAATMALADAALYAAKAAGRNRVELSRATPAAPDEASVCNSPASGSPAAPQSLGPSTGFARRPARAAPPS